MSSAAAKLSSIGHPAHSPGSGGWLRNVPFILYLVFAASCMAFAWWSVRRSGPGADDSDDGETGGGGWGHRPTPSGPPPDADPDWWPEFERQFAAYVSGLPLQETDQRSSTAPTQADEG